MPCYDDFPHEDQRATERRLQAATRAACEIVKLFKFVASMEKLVDLKLLLSKETQSWIKEHELIDKEKEIWIT